jgi:hypothetical protein
VKAVSSWHHKHSKPEAKFVGIRFNYGVGAVQAAKIGEPIRAQGYCPFKRQMAEVKTIDVKENPDGGDGKLAN